VSLAGFAATKLATVPVTLLFFTRQSTTMVGNGETQFGDTTWHAD